MSNVYERLDDKLRAFIADQKMFFVATAPLNGEGNVNLSPKGYDSLVVLDDMTIAYLDLGGSGVETIAHLRENGRITVMFCAMEGRPNILRLYGRGEVITFDDPGYEELLSLFPGFQRARAVIRIRLTRIADACGWAVPTYEYKGDRDQLRRYIDHYVEEAWREKRHANNALSIDGLPGLVRPK